VAHPHGPAAELERLVEGGERPIGVVQREEADGQEAAVVAAERRDHAVVGGGPAVDGVEVVGEREQPERERGEHELRREAELVECPAALGGVHRTDRHPAPSPT
jgi:hypothetical protein